MTEIEHSEALEHAKCEERLALAMLSHAQATSQPPWNSKQSASDHVSWPHQRLMTSSVMCLSTARLRRPALIATLSFAAPAAVLDTHQAAEAGFPEGPQRT